ncbi:DUF6428 family protein [Muriicola marianensis]|uniref:Uncharacterized protein n=1 Tax=Muriicola marianensis TaxID=1324801 RepID=A0ABQ1QV51_9FLAO|nr:DUF6428 family protein [Muriicola marianensis]GGD47799.1 hypothetical protein GCM10011361_13210 [Muriicola marianensis]
MKTSDFLQLLKEQSSKELIFEYAPGQKVGANYHITEVKNVIIESVDCGGRMDSWRETVIQLWESPAEINKTSYMSSFKAKSILDRVHSLKPMDQDAVLRFEYGNPSFHTAQLYANDIRVGSRDITIVLDSSPTRCKAEDICGVGAVPEPVESGCCEPGSGCC